MAFDTETESMKRPGKSDGPEVMLRLVDAAKLMKRSYQAVYNDVLSGRLPGERIDGKWYVPARAVNALIPDATRGSRRAGLKP